MSKLTWHEELEAKAKENRKWRDHYHKLTESYNTHDPCPQCGTEMGFHPITTDKGLFCDHTCANMKGAKEVPPYMLDTGIENYGIPSR